MSSRADIQETTGNESDPSELKEAVSTARESTGISNGDLHYVRRGQEVTDDTISTDSIEGYEAEQMRARALLTYEEEKKLLRRIDWHIMPLCSIAFLLKNIDSANVSNARIMNTGTHQNILKQLGMSSNEFNFVSTIYYVSISISMKIWISITHVVDPIYHRRGTVESVHQANASFKMAIQNHCEFLLLRGSITGI
jgi:hypothetical protein